ncbi:poly(R)-hydroxyalkanoic acid synthase, class I [Tepidicaulis marinus]|uniref:Poly(R)-hydroxyalkanoic acid synthase, class I n=1 Tax=Tepidicaulis marinus TaxID=1333998 RepID=A0A081B7S0_9HYPH|nr:poly(R)-hydroxyalkanoic acid synthase, class I [Tepidicaulis marinus]
MQSRNGKDRRPHDAKQGKDAGKGPGKSPGYPEGESAGNPQNLGENLLKAAIDFMELMAERGRTEDGKPPQSVMDILGPASAALAEAFKSYTVETARWAIAEEQLRHDFSDVSEYALKRMVGLADTPLIDTSKDKRFRHPAWRETPLFDILAQSYLLFSQWFISVVDAAEGLNPHRHDIARFYARQIVDALSPSNFLFTNPEVLRATVETNGKNLVDGLQNLRADFANGNWRLTQTDMDAFEIGRNIATTPGKVVYQNDLMQLIQYDPATEEVHQRPLVIVPPWINKYYILDLTEEKSFIKWAISKGYTVFVISWVNPDKSLSHKTFEDYMREGILEALDAVEKATGERDVNMIGYCIGGTLLSATLAYMAAKKDKRVKSATFFATQTDFTEAGDLKVFIDETQIDTVNNLMGERGGILPASVMAHTFNLLRPNDLIWNYVVGNYLMGRTPQPFDLLFWNADATRMPQKMHLFYLSECYLKNGLAEGSMELGGEKLDLSKVTCPVYLQSSRGDHIAPYKSVYKSVHLFGGKVTFTLAGSGHIAGVINPPAAKKYQYWANAELPETADEWLAGATEHKGSWWPDWERWLRKKSGKKVPARIPGDGALKVIEEAPGSYVRVHAKD